jgi:hypothetical protein
MGTMAASFHTVGKYRSLSSSSEEEDSTVANTLDIEKNNEEKCICTLNN